MPGIDLHTHSSVSDGTETPGQLIAAAVDAGLDVVALTDHDSTAGWDEAFAAARGTGLTVVPGIGLVEGAVDVHAAQWGNLSRLLAVVEAGLAPHGLALDECTTLEVGPDRVTGAGRVWRVSPALHVTRSSVH